MRRCLATTLAALLVVLPCFGSSDNWVRRNMTTVVVAGAPCGGDAITTDDNTCSMFYCNDVLNDGIADGDGVWVQCSTGTGPGACTGSFTDDHLVKNTTSGLSCALESSALVDDGTFIYYTSFAGGGRDFGVNDSTPDAELDIVADVGSKKALLVEAAATPSVNVVEVADSAGAAKVAVASDFDLALTDSNYLRYGASASVARSARTASPRWEVATTPDAWQLDTNGDGTAHRLVIAQTGITPNSTFDYSAFKAILNDAAGYTTATVGTEAFRGVSIQGDNLIVENANGSGGFTL